MDDDELLPGTRVTGSDDTPDACPLCETEVQPIEGAMLGQTSAGPDVNPEPWQEIATCPTCGAHLVRIPGDPWTGEPAFR